MGYGKILRRLLEYGILAPSLYNRQPWKFRVDPARGTVEVFADEARRRSPLLDPQGRNLYLALGACVEHMTLAAPAMGYRLKESLFPDGATPGLAARLTLEPQAETMPEPLFSTLLTRQTHAGKYKPGTVMDIHLARLRHGGTPSPEEAIYFASSEPSLSALQGLLHDLSHEGSMDPGLVREGADGITPSRESREGLAMETLGLPISVKARFNLLRFFGFRREMREVARQALLRQGHGIEAPAFLLASTRDPSPRGFFRCGRWQARLALTLSELELGSQALHLPITLVSRHSTLKGLFGAGESEEPVFLLRFGQPEAKKWPQTSRMAVEAALIP